MPQNQQDIETTELLPYEVSSQGTSVNSDYVEIVRGVEAGEQAAISRLYSIIQRGSRWYLTKQLGPDDAEDRLHDTFLALLRAIQAGELRLPLFTGICKNHCAPTSGCSDPVAGHRPTPHGHRRRPYALSGCRCRNCPILRSSCTARSKLP